MNVILKEKFNVLKSEIKETEHQIEILEEKITLTNKHLSELTSLDDDKKNQLKSDIESLQGEIKTLAEKQKQLQEDINKPGPDRVELDQLAEKRKKLVSLGGQIKGKIQNNKSQKKFFEVHTSCPTCKQEMSQEMRTSSINELDEKIKETEAGIGELDAEIEKVEEKHKEVSDFLYEIQQKASDLTRVTGNITSTQSRVTTLQERLDTPSADTTKTKSELSKLKNDLPN
jgi:chromosome segregation ATPase